MSDDVTQRWLVRCTESATFFQHKQHRDVTVTVNISYVGARLITTFYVINDAGVARLNSVGVRTALREADELVRATLGRSS